MTPAEFRRCGYALIDWIADYHAGIDSYPVLSSVEPGQVRSSLPEQPPLHGEPFLTMLRDVEELLLPGITHWQSPSFFAYFPANNSFPSILGELLSAGLGVQGMLWATSPACTELETHVLDWLVDMLALPEQFRSTGSGGGVIQDSASSAVLCALIAAREQASGGSSNRYGCDGRLVAYASAEAHSSIEKAVKIIGLGSEHLRRIPTDERCAMIPQALAEQLEADLASGLRPCFVCATIGSTSSLAVDPLPEIARISRQYGVWLHADAAMLGVAALCPEYRFIHDGLVLADSYCLNPHKWLFTNFDCSCFFVANRAALTSALTILPEYLRNPVTEAGAAIDYRDWQIPLGRRFRALKLWFVLRHYGIEGLRHHLRRHVELASLFAGWVQADPRFELMMPTLFNLICFRLRGSDELNRKLLDRLNGSGQLFMTHSRLRGRLTLRLCVGQTNTELEHVERAWQLICTEADSLKAPRTSP